MSTRSNSSCPPDPFAYRVDAAAPVESCEPDSTPGSTPQSGGAGGDLLPEALIASPIAAWGYGVPLPPGVTLADEVPSDSSSVQGPRQPNADYEVLVVESPWVASSGSPARADDPVNPPVLKKILLSEFITEYVGEVRSYVFNVRGGLSIDEGLTLNALFQWILEERTDSPMHVIVRARNPTDPIFIDRLVTNYANNVTIEFRSPVVFGASGGLRLMGDQPEIIRNKQFKAKLLVAAEEGDTVLQLATTGGGMLAEDFENGDVIIIRGQNDASGKALTKQTLHIVSRDTGPANTITVQEALDDDYEVTYPDSDWLADLTTGTTISLAAFAAATGNWARGDQTVSVNPTQLASSGIAVGSVVLVSTSEVESDLNPHAPYENSARLEIKNIIAIAGDQTTVTFDSPLVDNYATAKHSGITLYSPITNSVIRGVRASYNAAQTSRNTHGIQLGYGYDCKIVDCQIDGSGGQKGNGIRISNSLECEAKNTRVSNPANFASAEGYGHSIYYSDRCRVIGSTAEGCRHNFLVQKSNHTTFLGCTSINDRISGFDCHGVNEINTAFLSCVAIGGPLLSPDATHKSLFRVGNTSHAIGSFGTSIIGCTMADAQLTGLIATYAGLEVFGTSANVSMRGCYGTDLDTAVRSGYDNDSVTEPDPILNLEVEGNTWVRINEALNNPLINHLHDKKSTSSVEFRGGILRVTGTNSLATGASSTTATILFDATAPLVSEGAQVITTSYIARQAGCIVKVAFVCPFPNVGVTDNVLVALFAGSVCIGVAVVRVTTGANSGEQLTCTGTFTGDGTSQTISARIGTRTGVALYCVAPGKSLGGLATPYFLIEE